MPKKPPKKGQCIYCGRFDYLAPDHIPPASLFAHPRPPNLISVPACPKCNRGFSKDDEYFRWALGLREDVAEHPDIKGILLDIMRGLARKESSGFRASTIQSLTRVEVYSPGGVLLGFKPGYNVDLARILGTAKRITRGLFYRENRTRLSDDYDIRAVEDGMTRDWSRGLQNEVSDFISRSLSARPQRTIGNKVFSYRFYCAPDNINASVWMMVFYEKVFFLTITGTKEG